MTAARNLPDKILWFVSTTEDTHFLKSFAEHFTGEIRVVHLNFITRFDLSGFKGRQYLPFVRYADKSLKPDVSKTFNVLSNRLTEREALLAYQSTWGLLKSLGQELSEYLFVIPSGRHVHHVAATDYAKQKCIKRLYINYSNFPGYTFFDPEGTDCLASIYHDPARLDRLYPEAVDVNAVFDHFAALKRNQKAIPQAAANKWKSRIKHQAFVADSLLQKLLGLIGDRRVEMFASSVEEEYRLQYDEISLQDPFIFFPMQVSTDQQVLVNYDGGSIIAALQQALDLASEKGCLLYVREHPAEARKSWVRKEMEKIRAENSHLRIVKHGVAELIEHSQGVVTINSTVGLECRLNRKPVWFLGKSFYQKASDEQLAKYLSRYFVEVDYHDPCEIKENLDYILERSFL